METPQETPQAEAPQVSSGRPSMMDSGERESFLEELESASEGHLENEPELLEDVEPEPELAVVEPTPEKEPDAELTNRLAAIQAATKKQQDESDSYLATEKAQLARDRAELDVQLQEVAAGQAEYKAALEGAKYNPVKLLKTLGISTAEDQLAIARMLHAESVAQSPNASPEQRAAAHRNAQQREATDKLEAMEARLAEMQDTIKNQDSARQQRANIDKYMVGMSEAITDESPFTANLHSRDPKKVATQLENIASHLAEKSGEAPDYSDVIKVFEEHERNFYVERGLDPAVILEGFNATPKKTPPVAEEKRAASLGNDLGTPTKPRADGLTRDEEMASVRRALDSDNFE